MKKIFFVFLLISSSFLGCSQSDEPGREEGKNLTIFFINDQHGQIYNFAKIKHIVDKEREKNHVILACSGDVFSGNPVVDYHIEKGYPMIDLMNTVGFDVSTIGNHEFDYGESVLYDRLTQSEFTWICANVDMAKTGIPQPDDFVTFDIAGIKITFLGIVETYGKENDTIPSTHPWKVQNINFSMPWDVLGQYADLKEREDADLLVALTHIGHEGQSGDVMGDFQMAYRFPYFDLILGGHSHSKIDAKINGIPTFQTGAYLSNLGKVSMVIKDRSINSIEYELIDLNSYIESDLEIQQLIDQYYQTSNLGEVIGFSARNHSSNQVGCFFTDALRTTLDVDVSFQNTGGIRWGLDQGEINLGEIFQIDPFNNGSVIYEMSVREIKDFLKFSGSGFYYSGIKIERSGSDIQVKDPQDNLLFDDQILTIGLSDYVPAVHESYFPENGEILELTTAEILIKYLREINDQVDYPDCGNYFRFQED